jgi:hypothetical protein
LEDGQLDFLLVAALFLGILLRVAVGNYGWTGGAFIRLSVSVGIMLLEYLIQTYRSASGMESMVVNLLLHTSPFWMFFAVSDWEWRDVPPAIPGLLAACISTWEVFLMVYVVVLVGGGTGRSWMRNPRSISTIDVGRSLLAAAVTLTFGQVGVNLLMQRCAPPPSWFKLYVGEPALPSDLMTSLIDNLVVFVIVGLLFLVAMAFRRPVDGRFLLWTIGSLAVLGPLGRLEGGIVFVIATLLLGLVVLWVIQQMVDVHSSTGRVLLGGWWLEGVTLAQVLLLMRMTSFLASTSIAGSPASSASGQEPAAGSSVPNVTQTTPN